MATFTKAISATASSTRALAKQAGRHPSATSSNATGVRKGMALARARTVTTALTLTGGGISYHPAFLVFYYEDQEEQGPPMPGVGEEDFLMRFPFETYQPTFADEPYRPTIRRD
jgi:hypothetical protein